MHIILHALSLPFVQCIIMIIINYNLFISDLSWKTGEKHSTQRTLKQSSS